MQWQIQDFPLGVGALTHLGASTSDMGAFCQKRMQKQRNWVPFGGCVPAALPGSANAMLRDFENKRGNITVWLLVIIIAVSILLSDDKHRFVRDS